MNRRERAGLEVLRRMARVGTLELDLPGGRRTIGSGSPAAQVTVHDYSALADVFRRGLLGFAEAYMDERVDTDDLPGLLQWGGANQRAWFDHPLARATLPLRAVWQRIYPDWRHPRVVTMNDHYNLGNAFYEEWLGETMTYSSARFASPDQPLDAAQIHKYATIADHVGLEPGMEVLEVGCGWGGFAEYAAGQRGCRVVGITLSEEQAAYAAKRVAAAGLADRVEIRVQDFRHVTGQFDAVVSIEMIESVDEAQWPPLFATISRSLAPGARAAMQIITIDDDHWERYRLRADFIKQYIFPGGQLPAPKVLHRLAAGAGLQVEQVETFGLDYARTLSIWRERFVAVWPHLAAEHALDERFRRMWDLYLSLCEIAFRTGRIDVSQWGFQALPATRP